MKTKNPVLLLLLSIFLLIANWAMAQTTSYFPDNCWGVCTWGGDSENLTSQEFPLVKGAPIIMRWNELEPEPGKFRFGEIIGKKLELADKYNFYTFLKIWVAPNAP